MLDDYHIDGCIEHNQIDYWQVYRPDSKLDLSDFDRMWQIINLRTVKEMWGNDGN